MNSLPIPSINLSIFDVSLNLGIGFLLSTIISLHYLYRSRTRILRKDLAYALPAIGLTTLLVITVVKSSLALSLGLVGALSIVRFRTPIKETDNLLKRLLEFDPSASLSLLDDSTYPNE